MPRDIPGFYYDAERNRYFPIKSPIPGSSRTPKPVIAKPTKVIHSLSRTTVRTSKLLQGRELYGNVISSNKGKCNFEEEFRKTQASRPKVWRYPKTDKLGVCALERMHVNVQTPEGETKTNVLLTGGRTGDLSISEVEVKKRHRDVVQSAPDCIWPVICLCRHESDSNITPGNIWRDLRASIHMPSTISSIKMYRNSSPLSDEAEGSIQYAVISTLGSGKCGGSLHVLNLSEPIIDFYPTSFFMAERTRKVAALDCTIWTADCGYNNKAVVGTNLGAALVDLETQKRSWVLRSETDVLAQQLVQSGNVILCGLRNGAIVTVDVREKQDGSSASLGKHAKLARHKVFYPSSDGKVEKSSKPYFKLSGNIYPSHTIKLPSSITSLVALQFDDQYFLASSMDGSIRLYDHRLAGRGLVQTYEGNVNSHTRIQLGVDPFERFVMSGGEDSYLRLWSIKSGELLFQDKFSDSVLSTVCWRGETRLKTMVSDYNETESMIYGSGAWLGSQEGLFYVQC